MAGKSRKRALQPPAPAGKPAAPSRQVLEQAPVRALALLRAVGADANIRAALDGVGFTDGELDRGWQLLRDASSTLIIPLQTPTHSALAFAQLDEEGARALRLARVALRHFHPDYEDFLLPRPAKGSGAVFLPLQPFLAACEKLEDGRGRAATRKADRAVLATLEARGLSRAERKRLAALMNVGIRADLPLIAIPDKELLTARLVALHAWVQGWCATARTVLTRRDQLIRLGIGKRRMPTRGAAPTVPNPGAG